MKMATEPTAAELETVAYAIAVVEGAVIGEAADFAKWHWEEFTDHARAAIFAIESARKSPTP
jgi:hypothetical protein